MRTSESLTEYNKAMVQFKKIKPTISKKRTATVQMKNGNKYSYKYADLADIIEAVDKALADCGLYFEQNPVERIREDKIIEIGAVTRVEHVSGEFKEFDPVWLEKKNGLTPQEVGSLETYAKKYALCFALGIAAEEDEDANLVQPNVKNFQIKKPNAQTIKQQQQNKQPASPCQQYMNLKKRLALSDEESLYLCSYLTGKQVQKSEELKDADYRMILKKIKEKAQTVNNASEKVKEIIANWVVEGAKGNTEGAN